MSSAGDACANELHERLESLRSRGVVVVDPRQTYIAPEVDLDQIAAGVVLYPGTSMYGSSTRLGPGVELGREGPVTLRSCVLARGASIASGFAEGCVLLEKAKLGANVHARGGTLLEEESSCAHAVGLKQTILLPYVTLGSLINFCDCLMAGGTSRHDHSEVGSGYIHFNYTPWGERGDKATASLFGDVVDGVLGRQPRIFLGGLGASVGPRRVGYGSVAAAGQVLRRDLPAHTLAFEAGRSFARPFRAGQLEPSADRVEPNLLYMAQLLALQAFYRAVRIRRAELLGQAESLPVYHAAVRLLDGALDERWSQLARYASERGIAVKRPGVGETQVPPPLPLDVAVLTEPGSHLEWLRGRNDQQIDALRTWLVALVEQALR